MERALPPSARDLDRLDHGADAEHDVQVEWGRARRLGSAVGAFGTGLAPPASISRSQTASHLVCISFTSSLAMTQLAQSA